MESQSLQTVLLAVVVSLPGYIVGYLLRVGQLDRASQVGALAVLVVLVSSLIATRLRGPYSSGRS